jgi:hypothetical protein
LNCIRNSQITVHGHPLFLAKSILTERERPPRVIFQLHMVHN